jgi:large subunit ribosomal protein L17
MRHKRKGRQLGRSSSHRKAMLKNLASALFLTERTDEFYEGMTQGDGKTAVNPPQFKGRVTTTLQKAKEVRPIVEKAITLAKKAQPHLEAAAALETDAERNTSAWKSWREGEGWQKWNQAIAPAIHLRRRAYTMLGDKDAVEILFDEVAPRFTDRDGGYTRVLRLAKPRLGDAGTRAIIEFVGENDRVKQKSAKPAFVAETPEPEAPAEEEAVEEETAAEETAAEETVTDASAEATEDASEE